MNQNCFMKKHRAVLFFLLIGLTFGLLSAQEGFSDKNRALYIMDISKYVIFDESFDKKHEFVISVLDNDDHLYWELQRMSQVRHTIQGKPIRIWKCVKTEELKRSSVVFVNSANGYAIRSVLDQISGKNTLLISEGYPFRSSMINFVVVNDKLEFEANEEVMNNEGITVSQLTLHRAIKTMEDWESLYDDTEDELEMEKSITEQQGLLLELQMKEIHEQEDLIKENSRILEELRGEIDQREQEIEQKSKVLEAQEGEIEEQKLTIREQVGEVRLHRETLADQEKRMRGKEMDILQSEEEIRQQNSWDWP